MIPNCGANVTSSGVKLAKRNVNGVLRNVVKLFHLVHFWSVHRYRNLGNRLHRGSPIRVKNKRCVGFQLPKGPLPLVRLLRPLRPLRPLPLVPVLPLLPLLLLLLPLGPRCRPLLREGLSLLGLLRSIYQRENPPLLGHPLIRLRNFFVEKPQRE